MTRAIQGEWPAPATSLKTLEAESGLSILDKPYYFYIMQADDSYGFVVFVLSEAEGAVWPEKARGATPLDSGGWWLGKVHTEPPLDEATRQAAFGTLDVPLRDWRCAFEHSICAQHGTICDYIYGRAPKSDHPPETGFTIIKGEPNTRKAWTWEIRVPHDLISGRLTLEKIFMTEASRVKYVDWLWYDSSLADSESYRIDKWISHHLEVSKQAEFVVPTVRAWLAREAGCG